MQKETLGIVVLVVAGLNVYWAARIHTLLSFRGTEDEMATRKKRAAQLSKLSKISYGLILVSVGAFLFFKGR
jgi:hypothetical protein